MGGEILIDSSNPDEKMGRGERRGSFKTLKNGDPIGSVITCTLCTSFDGEKLPLFRCRRQFHA